MKPDWKEVFGQRSNSGILVQDPISPIPWVEGSEENLRLTLEWLTRARFGPLPASESDDWFEPLIDNWYSYNRDRGRIYHICDPQELFRLRRAYEYHYVCLKAQPAKAQSLEPMKPLHTLNGLAWSMNTCIGVDGELTGEWMIDDNAAHERARWQGYKRACRERIYRYQCSRCADPIPRKVKVYLKLSSNLENLGV